MPSYKVLVVRTRLDYQLVDITAGDKVVAGNKAKKYAGDHSYRFCNRDDYTYSIRRVEDAEIYRRQPFSVHTLG